MKQAGSVSSRYVFNGLVRKYTSLRHYEYMRQKFENYTRLRPRLKKTVGWFLVIFGFIMLVTPLTPGGILFFVGLEVLGLRTISEKSENLKVKTSAEEAVKPYAVETGMHKV